jgi:hypothetical protein
MALMMEAVRTSETSVYYNQTARRNIPEGYLSSSASYQFVKQNSLP